ncbi:high affinity copper uptake protein 1-like isoform X2 [Schistocerca cancellata]|nr:high affinity copper uptake protein 1-like isoform X2 [Schistocerca cancellata]XP_049782465.1 high affinity copper uptake protein 1-like isoform X2 [Schistocerca cancellata]
MDHSGHHTMDHSAHHMMNHSAHHMMNHSAHHMMNHSMGNHAGHVGHDSPVVPTQMDVMVHDHNVDTSHIHDSHDLPDHAGHDACGNMHGHSMMAMTFHTGYCETVLFDSWKVSSVNGLIGSMIGILCMAALYEGLKYYREYLFWKTYTGLQYRSVSVPAEKNVVSEDNQVVDVVGEVIHKQPRNMFSSMHFFQTFLHVVQIILSYFLMLIFMTYNVWLCMAVVIGAALGYFLFGWKKSAIVDVTEHCH